mmetsp:Transcript_28498/g.75463  ORF Transcript_28498/g.75463 Transcript_28498/m.75463 type:complete len:408 (+) Transcript_28498:137-1360(+)
MGIDTVPAFLAEETARSGWAFLAIQAIVSGGSTLASGEFRLPSTMILLASSKTQPSSSSPSRVTGIGAMDGSLSSCGSKDETRWRLSMETLSLRAVCCRSAFRNTSGRRKSHRDTEPAKGVLELTRLTQSLLSAMMRLARLWRKTVGSSGADGQFAIQPGGTSERMRQLASAWMSGVLSTLPLITFCSVCSELVTRSPSFEASYASMSTKATMGGSSGVTARTSMLRSLDSCAFETFSHCVNSGLRFCFHALVSTPPEPPPEETMPDASWRSTVIAFVELMRCSALSALGAMPKACGLSKSGSCSTFARKSSMFVLPGMSKGGTSTLPIFRRGTSSVSFLKNIARYSRTRRESNSLSTRLPYTACSSTPMSVTQSMPPLPLPRPCSASLTSSDTVSHALDRSLCENS